MNEQKTLTFSEALLEYITMAIKIWPGLKISLIHLSEANSPPQGSLIPNRNYRDMTSEQFISQIITDLHEYIMEHDVQSQHLEEYLDDILAILNSEQENFMTIRYMANQMAALLQELPENNYERFYKFKNIYEDVQANGGSVEHQIQGDISESDDDDQQDYDEEYENNDDDEPSAENNNNEQEVPKLMSQEQQQELEDDGWVIVTKKSKKK